MSGTVTPAKTLRAPPPRRLLHAGLTAASADEAPASACAKKRTTYAKTSSASVWYSGPAYRAAKRGERDHDAGERIRGVRHALRATVHGRRQRPARNATGSTAIAAALHGPAAPSERSAAAQGNSTSRPPSTVQ